MVRTIVKTSRSSINLLANPATASYFATKEQEVYYHALKHVGSRRDFHPALVDVCNTFIAQALDGENEQLIDELIATASATAASGLAGGGLIEEARNLHPQGFALLQLQEPLSYESLKSAYREAAKRYHPDCGGSHDAMTAINTAYQIFHSLIEFATHLDDGSDDPEPYVSSRGTPIRTCRDYVYAIGALLFSVALDEWALDEAFVWLERITSKPWQRSRYARNEYQRIDLIEPAAKLATRLELAGRHAEAELSLAVAREGLRVATALELSYDRVVQEAEEAVAGRRRPKLVLNHPRQAANAHRLGIIDAKRYAKVMENLSNADAKDSQYEAALAQFVAAGGFLQALPTDVTAHSKQMRARLVPEPGYFTHHIANLSDDQQAEYLSAYGPRPTLHLVRKYACVRLQSLLDTAMLHPGTVPLDRIEREARTISKLLPGSREGYGSDVADAVQLLAEQPEEERRERLLLVGRLHRNAGRLATGGLTLSIGDMAVHPFSLDVTTNYLDLVRRPLADLRHALRSGNFPESSDAVRESAAWKPDLDALGTPEIEDLSAAAFAALRLSKDNPSAAASALQVLVERLLALGKVMVHVQELQVGYWIDKLSIALVRLKRWDEARHWIETYFELPERYRARSSPSEQECMQRRLERCRKMLG
ncbi:J domain-containing protein [Sorangium sp. So ce861]|uniref:J domain-containing protein n=1 Tax=Sorangium sp. So ce861 TaxID=3133323 RepID=UPI003F5EA464